MLSYLQQGIRTQKCKEARLLQVPSRRARTSSSRIILGTYATLYFVCIGKLYKYIGYPKRVSGYPKPDLVISATVKVFRSRLPCSLGQLGRRFGRMNDPERSRSHSGGATRVSLACLPCRSRHVRCDATQPSCARCSSEGRQCHYAKSRRGGLDRAALAARRDFLSPVSRSPCQTTAAESREQSTTYHASSPNHGHPSPTEAAEPLNPQDVWLPDLSQLRFTSLASDPFIDFYYSSFHRFHPYILPRRHLQRLYSDSAKQPRLKPLVSAMRFIGSLYAQSEQSSRLKDVITKGIGKTLRHPPDPFMAQFHLLFAIALFWCGDDALARKAMDSSIGIAMDLAMFRRQFAVEHGEGDLVLEESWRRTWWQIYIVDAFMAATTHAPTFPTCDIVATTELPCEEEEYESGVR